MSADQIIDTHVTTATTNGIATIEFANPQSNSLPYSQLQQLAKHIKSAAQNDAVKVIVIKSAGIKTFCAGASFDELVQITNESDAKKFFTGFADVINAMRKCSKFIIARVQGKCVGGGVGLAAAADYAIAMNDADIKLSELAIGIGPFVIGPAVERKIGTAAFSALAIDAHNWRPADWAKKKGLFAETHETLENLDEFVNRLATSLTNSSIDAMTSLKKVLWTGTDNWDSLLDSRAAISGNLLMSSYTQNALQKLKKKS